MAYSHEGSGKRPGIIIHDPKAVRAQSIARPMGFRGRGLGGHRQHPSMKQNPLAQQTISIEGRPEYKVPDREVPNLIHEQKENAQTSTSKQSNSNSLFYGQA